MLGRGRVAIADDDAEAAGVEPVSKPRKNRATSKPDIFFRSPFSWGFIAWLTEGCARQTV